jgi:hypothetical protein
MPDVDVDGDDRPGAGTDGGTDGGTTPGGVTNPSPGTTPRGGKDVTLTIKFVGLCTVVQSASLSHVVFPPTVQHAASPGGHTQGVPRHVPMLFLGDATPIAGEPVPGAIELTRCVLHVRDAKRPAGLPPIPTGLLSISELTGGTLKPAVLAAAPPASLVNGRVDLDLHGSIRSFLPGKYEFARAAGGPPDVRTMDTFLQWTELVDENDLVIELELLDAGAPAKRIRIIPPHDALGNITLHVYHVIEKELPPNPPPDEKQGAKIEHFDVYYQLFDGVQERLIPVLKDVSTDGAGEGPRTRTCPGTRG